MKETLSNEEEIGYLFNVDVLIKNRSNALALQSLLELMNKEEQIVDFRIQSGIELGKIIEATIQSKKESITALHNGRKKAQDSTVQKSASTNASSAPAKKEQPKDVTPKKESSEPSQSGNSFDEWIDTLIKENRLTRIVVNNKNGKHQSIPCRILNFDRENNLVSIYHVDEKQVYTFKTNEIDEFL